MTHERFSSVRFFDDEQDQWIVGIHDSETGTTVFVADEFVVAPGICAKDATADQLGYCAFVAQGQKPN